MNDCFDLHLDLHQKAKGTCVFIFRVSNYYARKKLYDDYGCRDTDFVLAFLYFCTISYELNDNYECAILFRHSATDIPLEKRLLWYKVND
jgi:hypothetical protein